MRRVQEHRWAITFDGGSATLICLDPCPTDEAIQEDKDTDGNVLQRRYCHCAMISDLYESLTGEHVVELDDELVQYFGSFGEATDTDYSVWITAMRDPNGQERKEISDSSKSGHTSAVMVDFYVKQPEEEGR